MYRIRKRALSIVLLVTMILTLMPVSAAAAEDGTAQATPHILSTIKHEVGDDGAETGQITAQIEAYLTDSANKTRTVKPCDIIFLIEQSTRATPHYMDRNVRIFLTLWRRCWMPSRRPRQTANTGWRFRVMDASIIPAIRIPMSQINIRG